MVDRVNNKETNNKEINTAQTRAGALKSTLTVQLHTQYAFLLWEGRQRQKETKKSQIVSMPQVIARAGQINADSNSDNPYADTTMLD